MLVFIIQQLFLLVQQGKFFFFLNIHHLYYLILLIFFFLLLSGYDKNLTYKSGRCPVKHILTKSIPLALSKKFDFEKIITHTLKLSDGEKAYNIFDKKLDGCIKVVFKI